jgi:hypothetical protein
MCYFLRFTTGLSDGGVSGSLIVNVQPSPGAMNDNCTTMRLDDLFDNCQVQPCVVFFTAFACRIGLKKPVEDVRDFCGLGA